MKRLGWLLLGAVLAVGCKQKGEDENLITFDGGTDAKSPDDENDVDAGDGEEDPIDLKGNKHDLASSTGDHDDAGVDEPPPDMTTVVFADLASSGTTGDLASPSNGGSCPHYQFNPYTTDKDWVLWSTAPLAAGAPAISASGVTVVDPRTGLEWQRATKAAAPADDYGYGLLESDAIAYCNNLVLAGYDDWRLPSFNELLSIAKLDQFPPPTIDHTLFPDSVEAYYYTSSYLKNSTSGAKEIFNFANGTTTYSSLIKHYARCVRATCTGAALPNPHYTSNGTTVVDHYTNLEWRKTVEPTSTPELTSASAATLYCQSLGTGWRVPTVAELMGLIDYSIGSSTTSKLDPIFDDPYYADYWAVDGRTVEPSFAAINAGKVGSFTHARCVR